MLARDRLGAVRTYLDVPGWFDFQDIYDQAIEEAPFPDEAPATHVRFVEVGVAFGKSAIYMADRIRAAGKVVDFYTIDSWRDNYIPGHENLVRGGLGELVRQMGGLRETAEWYMRECGVRDLIHTVQLDSVSAAREHADGSIDLVFLDADHSYKGTTQAVSAWLRKVRPGGIFAGHDFTDTWPGVVQAVREILPGAERRRSSFFWRVPE
jgi:predicted O-methyltransferase YrrM